MSRRPLQPTTARPENVPLVPVLQQTAGDESKKAASHRRDEVLANVEAILWLADEPLPLKKLAALADIAAADAQTAIERLREMLDADGSAFQIEELGGGFQLLTRPAFYPWLARVRRGGEESKLTPALMETLAVVAYRQPLTRADLEAIRGVRCDDALKILVDRKLIEIVGKHDSLGRPALYGTTKKFLQTFGLKDVSELPAMPGSF